MEPVPGSRLPIPCRSCGRGMIPFRVEVGRHLLRCSSCGKGTGVTVIRVGGRLRVWSRKAP